jgi:hypothetical protein
MDASSAPDAASSVQSARTGQQFARPVASSASSLLHYRRPADCAGCTRPVSCMQQNRQTSSSTTSPVRRCKRTLCRCGCRIHTVHRCAPVARVRRAKVTGRFDTAELALGDSTGRVVDCGRASTPTTLAIVKSPWRRKAESLFLQVSPYLQVRFDGLD